MICENNQTLEENFEIYNLPDHWRGGLQRYFEERIRPGAFIASVLTNDFHRAIMLCDVDDLPRLRSLALMLYNEIPSDAWGDAKKVETWTN